MAYRRRRSSSKAKDPFLACLMLIGGILVGASFMTLPYSERVSNNADNDSPSHPECNDNNWSAGSAFFTIAALCFGYYAYPRGSLIMIRSGRTWRLSPILVAQESIVLLSLLGYGLTKGFNRVTICYTILAYRIYNGFNPAEVRDVLEIDSDPPPFDDLSEVYRRMKEEDSRRSRIEPRPPLSQPGLPSETVREDQPARTAESNSAYVANEQHQSGSQNLQSGRETDLERHDVPTHAAMDNDTGISRQANDKAEWQLQADDYITRLERAKSRVAQRRVKYNRQLFESLFRYMQGLDSGPSYRIFVWAPMLLQVFKLTTIFFCSKHVSIVTFLIAWTYFFSWLIIELIMMTIAYNPLPENGIEDAAELAYTWRDFLNALSAEEAFIEDGVLFSLRVPALFIVTIVNAVFTGMFAFHNGWPFVENFFVAVIAMCGICIGVLLGFYLCTMPISLWFLSILVGGMAKIPGVAKCVGKPWVVRQPPDPASLYPASVALHGAVLAILAYSGVGPWRDFFPCWNMEKPSFYDWLG